MKSFIQFDKSSNTLTNESKREIPDFCLKCISDNTKKCQNFYKNILDNCSEGLYQCPYGFYSYFKKNNIYTSIILKDKDNSKLIKTLKMRNDKINNYDLYSEEQLIDIMEDIDDLYTKNIELRDCMHDLRNMGGYFNSMSETIELKHPELPEQDDDIKAMLALYDLINYRLNVYYGVNESDNKRIRGKLYPIIRKLQIMMKYQAKKKKINVKIDYEQENTVILSKNIYLVMFILMENAIKHSLHNCDINIDFEESNDKTIFKISNRSPLIEETEYEKIFERGYRGKNAVSKGTGIGLSMVKEILDKHGYVYRTDIVRINNNESSFSFIIEFPCE